jgi:cytochrome c
MNSRRAPEVCRRSERWALRLCVLLAGVAVTVEAADGRVIYVQKVCGSCHGEAGDNPLPGYPKLGRQDREYLIQQMRDIKSGARDNGLSPLMAGYMSTVSEEEIAAIADYLSAR